MNSFEDFYEGTRSKEIDMVVEEGMTLAFDSNMLHQTLDCDEENHAILHMYTSPIIKPIVNYTSSSVLTEINENKYRLNEVMNVIGHRYLEAKDDMEYIMRKS